jgi:hypothetical protein
MVGGKYFFWLGAAADADRAAHKPSLGSRPSGEHPSRCGGCGCVAGKECALDYGGPCRWDGTYK